MWSETFGKWILVALCVCAVGATTESAEVIYVDDDASAGGSGASWTNACKYLQDALAIAGSATEPVEIHVAQGVYRPDQGIGVVPGDRAATFQSLNGVAIKGGYGGANAPDPHACDPTQYETILSGDLNADDVVVQDVSWLLSGEIMQTLADNSLHVVTGSGTDETAVLDGLVIAAGCCSLFVEPMASDVFFGAGMFNDSGSPTVLRCLFRDNFASTAGGAVYNRCSRVTFSECVYRRNAAGSYGGAMCNLNSDPVVTDCTFEENVAAIWGGAIVSDSNAVLSLRSCTFKTNEAGTGGALYNGAESAADLESCTFEGNHATQWDGGGAISSHADLSLAQCAFRRNSACSVGGAIGVYGGTLCVSDCLFSSNTVASLRGAVGGGGAIYSEWNAILQIGDSTFEGNSALNGGAVYGNQSYANFAGCRFRDNMATCPIQEGLSSGGGGAVMASNFASMRFVGCDLQGNVAFDGGGAIRRRNAARLALVNCVLAGNRAERGGGVYAGSVVDGSVRLNNCTLASNFAADGFLLTGSCDLEHCIVWGGDALVSDGDAMTTAVYCDVQGGYPGQGNINADPLFVRLGHWVDANDVNLVSSPDDANAIWGTGDYHLQSQGGRWAGDDEGWVLDAVTSPCIDAGDMGTPIGDELLPNGGILNLGAYGTTAEASKSYFGEPVCEVPIAGDINGDCKVDSVDAELMSQSWRISGTLAWNQPPTVVITQPVDGAVVEVSASNPSVLIVVDASDMDGFVRDVKFAVTQKTEGGSRGSSTMDTDGSDGWRWRWSVVDTIYPYVAGPCTVTAYAIDDGCEISSIERIQITIVVVE